MKKMLAAVTIAALVSQNTVAQNNNSETLEGNGKLVTKEISVQAFSELKASGVYELRLVQGAAEGVKIEADENLQSLFEVKNEGNKLVIEMKQLRNINLKSKNKLRVYVTFKNLKELELSTVGNVKSEAPLQFESLELNNRSVGNVDLHLTAAAIEVNNSSVGNIMLSGKAEKAVVKNSGVGNFKATDFKVQTMNIENNGVGNADVNAEKELKVQDSFLGKVRNSGTAAMRKRNKVVI